MNLLPARVSNIKLGKIFEIILYKVNVFFSYMKRDERFNLWVRTDSIKEAVKNEIEQS